MQRIIIGLTFYCILMIITCSPPPYGFVLNNQYVRNDFTGRELGGKTISMCPFLKDSGADTTGMLSSGDILKSVSKSRSDLRLISVREMEKRFREKWGSDSLQLFYKMLSLGEIIQLQNSDSLWNGIGTRYFMALRLKSASKIKSFNRSVRKRISLEAELWDRELTGVVWRVVVNGLCIDESIQDSKFISSAIVKAYEKLPVILPAYDSKDW